MSPRGDGTARFASPFGCLLRKDDHPDSHVVERVSCIPPLAGEIPRQSMKVFPHSHFQKLQERQRPPLPLAVAGHVRSQRGIEKGRCASGSGRRHRMNDHPATQHQQRFACCRRRRRLSGKMHSQNTWSHHRVARCLTLLVVVFCLPHGHIQHHHFGPHVLVEENCVCRKHQTLQNELDFPGLEGLEGLKVGNIKQTDQHRGAHCRCEMAKLHISRLVQLWCGDYPAGLCRVRKSTLCACHMAGRVSVGLKTHVKSSSNGSSRPASHITGASYVRWTLRRHCS